MSKHARTLDAADPADRYLVEIARNVDPVTTYSDDDVYAALYPLHDEDNPSGPPEGYVVWWTDGVANDWAEYLPTLPLGLVRFAALIDAGTRGAFYETTVEEFAADVAALFGRHAKVYEGAS